MICTFYSYKGGVGRTVALANLAELFYQAGLRVLAIDWDLTAPGLESYFPAVDRQKAQAHLGLIDMLLQYKEQMSYAPEKAPGELESLRHYLLPIYDDGFSPGTLHLLTAGRRSSEQPLAYQHAVLSFDWQEFYDIWAGESYFSWLREQFAELADIVLIDCRSGLSEMGNVCTYHLADVVLLFCGPDPQHLQGTYELAQRFTADRVRQVRAERPLKVIVVPARIEEQAGDAELLRWKYEFVSRFSPQNFAAAASLITTGDALWALRIPQVPSARLADQVAVRQPSPERHSGLERAYRLLLETLTQQTPVNSRLREFIKIHVLQNHQAFVEKSEPLAGNRLHEPYRLPLETVVKTCCEVYVRPTPGYVNKSLHEAVRLEAGVYARILDGPQVVDGVRWWLIVCNLGASTLAVPALPPFANPINGVPRASYPVRGWVAETTPAGVEQLQKLEIEALNTEIGLLFSMQ